MAYDSDTRIKNDLRSIGDQGSLKLRVFDESNDDQRPWLDGGLTFSHDGLVYGSNDGAWYKERNWVVNGQKVASATPVVVVEGSYGTERGNVGSAQYARFSHALGAVLNGLVGVYFMPKISEYHRNDGSVTTAKWRLDLVYGCLGASEIEAGEYLMVDAYDKQRLKDLVMAFGGDDESQQELMVRVTKKEMVEHADSLFRKTFRCDSVDLDHCIDSPRRSYAYCGKTIGKILMFNVVSFTNFNFRTQKKYKAGRYRNGHTIVGDALIHRYWFRRPVDMIFPRFTLDDCRELDKLDQKEWNILRLRDDVNIVTLDDLVFDNRHLEGELREFLDVLPLLRDNLRKKNGLLTQLKSGFRDGTVTVDRRRVEKHNKEGQNLILSSIRSTFIDDFF